MLSQHTRYLFQFFAAVALLASPTAFGQSVNIPDPVLEQAIRDQLFKPAGDITVQDMQSLQFLFVSGDFENFESNSVGVGSLVGLETATNLSSLAISVPNSTFTDLSPIAGLTQLQNLSIGFADIASLEPLAGLTNLSNLAVSTGTVSDLSPLAALTNLESLSITEFIAQLTMEFPIPDSSTAPPISDLSPLAGLNLSTLNLSSSALSDLSPLANMTGLTILSISSERLASLADLETLTSLESLFIFSEGLASLAGLETLTSLESLSIFTGFFNGIEAPTPKVIDLTPIQSLNPRDLSLAGLLVPSLGNIPNLAGLLSLNLNYVGDLDLTGIGQATSLTSLNLGGSVANDLSSLSPLADQLTSLSLFDSTISSLGPIADFTRLTFLLIDETPLADISVVQNFTALNQLWVTDSNVTAIPSLASLPLIQFIDFSGNDISDITPLANQTGVFQVDVRDNPIDFSPGSANLAALNQLRANNPFATILADAEPTGGEPIVFNDTVFGNVIREQLGIPPTEAITTTDLQGVTVLFGKSRRIANIEGISQMTNLIALDLSDNEIRDISSLRTMTQLRSLDLSGNPLDWRLRGETYATLHALIEAGCQCIFDGPPQFEIRTEPNGADLNIAFGPLFPGDPFFIESTETLANPASWAAFVPSDPTLVDGRHPGERVLTVPGVTGRAAIFYRFAPGTDAP